MILYTVQRSLKMNKIKAITFSIVMGLSVFAQAEVEAESKLDNNDVNETFTTSTEVASERLAYEGDVFTQFNLGLMYYYGDSANQDLEKAVMWLTRAAEQGYVDAQYHLGVMYNYYVKSPDIDYAQAMYWYKKAAEQNHAEAQNSIGVLYQSGQGVEQDYRIAKEWYSKSCDNDFITGCQNEKMLARSGY